MNLAPDNELRVPLASVVIPTYNRPGLLSRAVASVLQQSFNDWELLIVDDCSTVDVAPTLSDYLADSRVRLIRRQFNGGISAARNTGLRRARGRFICFLDDDDEFATHKLAHQVNTLSSAPHGVGGLAGSAIGWYSPTGPQGGETFHDISRNELLALSIRAPQIGTLLFYREIAYEIAFDETLRTAEELDMYIRLLARYRLICDGVPVMIYHTHGGPRSDSNSSVHLWTRVQLFERYRDDIVKHRLVHAKWHDTLSLSYEFSGYRRLARRHLMKSLMLAPLGLSRWRRLFRNLTNSLTPGRTLWRRLSGRTEH